jgi:hypothetical protein
MNVSWTITVAFSIGAAGLVVGLWSIVLRVLAFALNDPGLFLQQLHRLHSLLVIRAPKPVPRVPYVIPFLQAGVASMSTLDLSALPAWSQQQLTLPDGDYDPQRYNDCGEVCVAAIVSVVHGTPISPASVRANLGGPNRSGVTDGAALVAALAFYHVAALAASPSPAMLKAYVQHFTALHMPTIVLGTWPTPGLALHWLLTAQGTDMWHYINPWNGNHSFLPWPDMEKLYALQVVVATANPHYDMSKQPLPY